MSPGRHRAVLRRLEAAVRRGEVAALPAGVSPAEAAAALEAGAEALRDVGDVERSPEFPGEVGDQVPAGGGGWVRIRVDGAARGNPGPAGFGVVLEEMPRGPRIEHGGYLGEATNNVAEYQGLLWALAEARRRGFQAAEVRSDSELMVKQMRGEYRVKHPRLRDLHAEAVALAGGFRRFRIRHVAREENAEADALANRAIDEAQRLSAPPRRSVVEAG